MSTLSDHQANGIPKVANPQSADATAQIDEVLLHFDVLPSKVDKYIFKYAYFYLIGLFLLNQLWRIRDLSGFEDYSIGSGFTYLDYLTSLELLFIAGICLMFWAFKIWRERVPKTLHDIFESDYLYSSTDDFAEQYLAFLNRYDSALRNPRRYLLSIILIGAMVFYIITNLIPFLQIDLASTIKDQQQFIGVLLDIVALCAVIVVEIGFMYCLGILFWSLYINGQFMSNLSQTFELRIEPVHPDNCGGLHTLGNFCFASASPLIIGSAFFIGWLLVTVHFATYEIGPAEVALTLFIIGIGTLPIGFFASFLPLWKIHTKMLMQQGIDEKLYVAEVAPLQKKIHELVDANQLDKATNLKTKKELLESIHIKYPTWPFNIRTTFYTTILGSVGGLLLGVLSAWLQAYFH